MSRLEPSWRPPPSSWSSGAEPLLIQPYLGAVFRRTYVDAWIYGDAARLDAKIVVAAPESDPAQLRHLKPPPFRAVLQGNVLEDDHPMSEAVQLEITFTGALIVQEEDRALSAGEELLQCQDLSPESQRIASEQSHLRE